MTDLEVQRQVTQFNQEDMVELGAIFAATGLTTLEARAFVTQVQQAAAQFALAQAPALLEQANRIHGTRILGIMNRVRALPNMAGHISRDRVIQIIQDVYSTQPRS